MVITSAPSTTTTAAGSTIRCVCARGRLAMHRRSPAASRPRTTVRGRTTPPARLHVTDVEVGIAAGDRVRRIEVGVGVVKFELHPIDRAAGRAVQRSRLDDRRFAGLFSGVITRLNVSTLVSVKSIRMPWSVSASNKVGLPPVPVANHLPFVKYSNVPTAILRLRVRPRRRCCRRPC